MLENSAGISVEKWLMFVNNGIILAILFTEWYNILKIVLVGGYYVQAKE